jgi:hypothetical protein
MNREVIAWLIALAWLTVGAAICREIWKSGGKS